jgi:3-deoxy-D-manno-octulosonic-acid transferase
MLRERRPDVQLVYTFFSPSAEDFGRRLPVDYVDYLPFDTPGDARAAVTALAPTALVYSKLDLWPNFTRFASLRGIRLGMISATVSPGSRRRSWMTRSFLREGYSRLDAVGAVSQDDAERLVELGARREVVFVTGDTRYDQVAARAARADPGGALLAPLVADAPTIVAGSTWPSDERQLLPAFTMLRARHPAVRLVIAPHEPSPEHLSPIEKWADSQGLAVARLGAASASQAAVVLVDRLGVLGELYALATVAFVGGGFHSAGLHSVLEPAAFGAPVLFGPMFHESRDAVQLIRARGGSSVRNSEELFASMDSLLSDAQLLGNAQRAARAVVESGTGAAVRSYELVDALLST